MAVRALVVEDDPSWQQILTEILTDAGLEVDTASSYSEAASALRGASHRVAVLDLSLESVDHHNQDGMRVAEAVRKNDPGCAVLFLTGFATVELAVQVMQEYNAVTCLRKETFRRADLRKAVEQALTRAPVDLTAAAPEGIEPIPANVASFPDENAGLALVVEDDAGWRSLLTELLEDAGHTVQACASFVEAAGLLKREKVRLAVVDLSLASSLDQGNQDGFRLLGLLQKSSIPVIVVSGYADPEKIEQAFQERLIAACLEKQSFDRRSFLREAAAAVAASADPTYHLLTDREREVLALLASGMTNKEIARELTITANTVKRHLKSLFAKLGVSTRAGATARAMELGIHRE